MAVPGIMPKSLQICASYFIAQAWSFESVPCAPTLLSLHIEAPQTQRKRNAMHVPPSHCSLNGWNTSRGPERRVQQRHSAILSSTERSFSSPLEEASFLGGGHSVPLSWTTTADSCAVSSKARDAAILLIFCEHWQPPLEHYGRH